MALICPFLQSVLVNAQSAPKTQHKIWPTNPPHTVLSPSEALCTSPLQCAKAFSINSTCILEMRCKRAPRFLYFHIPSDRQPLICAVSLSACLWNEWRKTSYLICPCGGQKSPENKWNPVDSFQHSRPVDPAHFRPKLLHFKAVCT